MTQKYQRWSATGEDAIYIYKLLIASKNTLDFKQFLKTHQDWICEGRYKERNLRDRFGECKKRLKDFQNGDCKCNVFYFTNYKRQVSHTILSVFCCGLLR